MPKKTIAAVNPSGKRALIRVDFNVPIEDGQITDDLRIRAAVPTIKSVLSRGGAAVLVSHLGRPEGKGYEAEFSLEPCADRLSEILGKPVEFPSHDCTDDAAASAVASAKPGAVVLLENLRFHRGEKEGHPEFAAKLARYGDLYVNDAFGACHREDASMVALPLLMEGKPRVVGLLVEKELMYLSEALEDPKRPFVVVMGGAKVADKIGMINTMLAKADDILVGGAMAYTFLASLGLRVGNSRVEGEHLEGAKGIMDQAARSNCQLHLPADHVCSTQFAADKGKVEVFEGNIGDGFMGLDIGPKTQVAYGAKCRVAKTVVFNGPMGVFEWAQFGVGTRAVAEAIAEATDAGGTSIVGGGDSAAAVEQFGLAPRFSHVSTGGGASLEMLAGKPFRSVEILDDA